MDTFREFASAVLTIHSDASYNSEPKARSRTVGVFILGPANFCGLDAPPPNTLINAPVTVLSKRIPTVYASFRSLNAHTVGEGLRRTLGNLGHSQSPPTSVIYDNEVSGKIAICQCKVRRSQPIVIRYHWIRDRIATGHFQLLWRRFFHQSVTRITPRRYDPLFRLTFISPPPLW